MADEQAQADQPIAEEIQPQESVQETVSTEPEQPKGKGDLNEALRQEREARRQLEAQLSDPAYIYRKAQELGLTEEEAEELAEEAVQDEASRTPVQSGTVAEAVEFELSKRDSFAKYPQLKDDEDDQIAVTALMVAKGLSPMAAAEAYYAKMGKALDAARAEGAQQKETFVSAKESASGVTSTATTTSEAAEYEQLIAQSRDQRNPKQAQKAHLELLKWKERNR